MSDYIQALELQITSSTTAAHKSLDELAAALNKIRTAVGGTPKKLGTAVALENLANSIHKNLGADTTKMVQNLADSMKNLLDQARQLKDFRYAMSMVKAAVDAEKPKEGLENAVSNPQFTVSYAQQVTDANQAVVGSFRDTANEVEEILSHITPEKQLQRALNEMLSTGEITAKMYGRIRDEISHIDFNEGLGAHGKPELFGAGEAEEWIRDLERNLQLGDAEGMSSGPKAMAEETAKAVEQVGEMAPKMGEVKEEARMTAEQIADIGRAAVEANGQLGFMQMELQAKQQALGQGIMDGSMDPAKIARAGQEIIRLQERIEKLKEEQEKAAEASKEHESALKRLKEAALRGSSVFGQLGHRLKSLLVFRVFRTLLREVSEGFKIGLENVRKYGEAVNSLYYRDMSGLDNTLLKMKNSLGASLAAALRSVIPLFQQLASWVITVSNYVNQFFALLNGQSTWTRAVDVQTDALEDQQKAASGAAKSVKNLLASWDELNIIQSAGGGGGAGSAAEDLSQYERMFEEVGTFDQRIRDAINWVKDNMNEVYGIAAGIAALLLGARFSVALVIAGVTTSYMNGKESGLNGDTFLTAVKNNIIGIAETALGSALLGFKMAGVKGAILGLFIGVGIGIAATYIGWQEGSRERLLNAAWGDIHLTDEQIKQYINNMFGYDIYAEINVISTRVNGIKEAREALTDAIDSLSGKYSAMVALGIENASTEDVQSLATEVQDVVQKVQGLFDKHKVNIGVMLNKGIITEEEARSALGGIEGLNLYINGLGTDIGRILSDGVVDEFEKETLEGLMNALTRVTSAVTTGQRTGEAVGRVGTMLGNYDLNNLDYDSFSRLTTEYQSIQSEFRQLANDSAVEYQGMLYGVWQGMLEANATGTEHFTQEQIDQAEYDATHFPVEEYVDRMYQIYFGAADEEFKRRLREAAVSRMETTGAGDSFESLLGGLANPRIIGDVSDLTLRSPDEFRGLIDGIASRIAGFSVRDAGLDGWSLLTGEQQMAVQEYFARRGFEEEFIEIVRQAYGQERRTIDDMLQMPWEQAGGAATEAVEEVTQEVRSSAWRIWSLDEDDVQSLSAPEGFSARDALGQLHGNDFDYFIFRTDDGSFVLWDDVNSLPMSVSQGILDQIDEWYTQRNGGTPTGGGGGAPSVSENDTDDDVRDNERNAMLRQLITLAQEIANKDWTVTPSAGWGAFNAKSGQLYASVKG